MSLRGIQFRQSLLFIRKEVFRKAIHLCSGFLPLLLHFWKWPVMILLTLCLIFYIICEKLRMAGHNVPLISAVTQAAARKRDEDKFVLGPVMLVLGILFTALIFPEKNAAFGIYALAFGDGLASLSGKLFGRVRVPLTQGKTAFGSLTCFTAIFISSFALGKNAFMSLILASLGMFIEILPLKDFDNLVIPLAIALFSTFF